MRRSEMSTRRDVGDALIEIVLTIVIIGLTVTALLAGLGTVGNAGNAQRLSVQADVVMRNYAEAIKAATQSCVAGGTYDAVYPPPLPSGFSAPTGAGGACPDVDAPELLTLRVVDSHGVETTMDIRVSTP